MYSVTQNLYKGRRVLVRSYLLLFVEMDSGGGLTEGCTYIYIYVHLNGVFVLRISDFVHW